MEFLLTSLEEQLPKLLTLEATINNAIARIEIIEALQQKIQGNCRDNYEINFTRTILNRDRRKTINTSQKSAKISTLNQKIARFGYQHYLKISIGLGIATIVSYSLFLLSLNQQTIESHSEPKVEQTQ